MKKTRKILSSAIAVCLMFWSLALPTNAQENVDPTVESIESVGVYMSGESKTAFAAEMDKQSVDLDLRRNVTTDEIDMLLGQCVNASGAERESILNQLAQYGIYEYEGTVLNKPSLLNGSQDITMSVPMVVYDSIMKTWTVTCGGHWNTEDYGQTSFKGDVGGPDAFGVGYTQAGKYDSYVVSVSGTLSNGNYGDGYIAETTKNRSDGDGSKGFGFRIQDYMIYELTWSQYIGQTWSGSCTYDQAFGSFSGIATGYYIHTYDDASITSVQFGFDGQSAGISVTIQNQEKSFIAFSNDKRFGV